MMVSYRLYVTAVFVNTAFSFKNKILLHFLPAKFYAYL